jgi:hypothetical protein
MRSLGKGVQSATTQVKVSSPEIFHFVQGQGFHFLEASNVSHAKGECDNNVPGSKSVAGERTVYVGTWENRSVPKGSFHEAEEAKWKYGVSVVGLTHSRGVDRVMPVEFRRYGTLEGVSSLTQRDEV